MSASMKIVPLVERLGRVVDAVEDDRDQREGPAGVVTVAKRLGQEQPAEPSALELLIDARPRLDDDRSAEDVQDLWPGGCYNP
jgi:hypothetical protein